MNEVTENELKVSPKVQDIIAKLKTDYYQPDEDPKIEFRKNVMTAVAIFGGRAELWASGLAGGTKEEADQLMREGFRFLKKNFQVQPGYETPEAIVESEIRRLRQNNNKPNALADLMDANVFVFQEDKKK